MLHPDLLDAAKAIDLTAHIAQSQGTLSSVLPELVSIFTVGIVLLHRELLMHLWQTEAEQ